MLGIDIGGDGVTPNDPDESDGIQNYPVLTQVASYGGSVYASGTLNSTPSSTFTIEFYSNAVADPSGYGQGQTFLGSTVVSTDATGRPSSMPASRWPSRRGFHHGDRHRQ